MPQIKLNNTKTDPVRLSFNNLFEARSFQGGPLNYDAKFLIKKGGDNDKRIRAAMLETATEKFGKKAEQTIEKHKTNNMKCCYIDGDLDNQDEHDGFMVLSTKRKQDKGRPTVIDGKRNPLSAADGKPYSGCYVNAIVDIYAQSGEYEGIRGSLGAVQFAGDGDAFAGGSTPKADDFDEVDDGADVSDSFE